MQWAKPGSILLAVPFVMLLTIAGLSLLHETTGFKIGTRFYYKKPYVGISPFYGARYRAFHGKGDTRLLKYHPNYSLFDPNNFPGNNFPGNNFPGNNFPGSVSGIPGLPNLQLPKPIIDPEGPKTTFDFDDDDDDDDFFNDLTDGNNNQFTSNVNNNLVGNANNILDKNNNSLLGSIDNNPLGGADLVGIGNNNLAGSTDLLGNINNNPLGNIDLFGNINLPDGPNADILGSETILGGGNTPLLANPQLGSVKEGAAGSVIGANAVAGPVGNNLQLSTGTQAVSECTVQATEYCFCTLHIQACPSTVFNGVSYCCPHNPNGSIDTSTGRCQCLAPAPVIFK